MCQEIICNSIIFLGCLVFYRLKDELFDMDESFTVILWKQPIKFIDCCCSHIERKYDWNQDFNCHYNDLLLRLLRYKIWKYYNMKPVFSQERYPWWGILFNLSSFCILGIYRFLWTFEIRFLWFRESVFVFWCLTQSSLRRFYCR